MIKLYLERKNRKTKDEKREFMPSRPLLRMGVGAELNYTFCPSTIFIEALDDRE